MTDYAEEGSIASSGYTLVQNAVTEPGPEKDLACKLKPAVPPSWSPPGPETQYKVFPTQAVEIKSSQCEYWVV